MGPLRVNRRRFLGGSVAAGLALSQGVASEAETTPRTVRLGLLGAGTRGTTLLRTVLELPAVEIAAVADLEPKHRLRAQGIVERATQSRPDVLETGEALFTRSDVDAVLVALPCDEHATAALGALQAEKHVYAEKPLAPTLEECNAVLAEAERHEGLAVHVGYQRRSNPRYREAVALIRQGELGDLLSAQGQWMSSNGPMNGHGGWLGRRARSGDWMVEQAVHVWDVLHWITGSVPASCQGVGRRDLFRAIQPDRDVTDAYSALLVWGDGFHATFNHAWNAPPDEAYRGNPLLVLGTEGGIDLGSGLVTFRDRRKPRRAIHPGNLPDTKLALSAFLDAVRAPEPTAPPISLMEAREATRIGLLVRDAVDRHDRVSDSSATRTENSG